MFHTLVISCLAVIGIMAKLRHRNPLSITNLNNLSQNANILATIFLKRLGKAHVPQRIAINRIVSYVETEIQPIAQGEPYPHSGLRQQVVISHNVLPYHTRSSPSGKAETVQQHPPIATNLQPIAVLHLRSEHRLVAVLVIIIPPKRIHAANCGIAHEWHMIAKHITARDIPCQHLLSPLQLHILAVIDSHSAILVYSIASAERYIPR